MRFAVWAGLLCGLGGISAPAQEPSPGSTPAPPAAAAPLSDRSAAEISPDQIRDWAAELGASRFDIRDRAMQSLISAGESAAAILLAAAQGADREVALRSVMALREIGARGDADALQAALHALEQISARSRTPSLGREASDAMKSLMVVRQERAIEHLQKLGATVSREFEDQWYQQQVQFRVGVFTVEIGPQWQGNEQDLERLSWISDVEQVSFVGPQVQDSWFELLAKLPKLHSIKVKRATISNQALEQVSKMEGIWLLRLLFVPLDDSAVPVLQKCRSVRKLAFISRQLTEDGEKQLKDHFGSDNVECPRGALLGIKAEVDQGEAWSVSSVIEGSAAAKAGILENDRIVKYNGEPVADFLQLKALISRNAPGDTVTLEIERGLERLTKQVTFGEWD